MNRTKLILLLALILNLSCINSNNERVVVDFNDSAIKEQNMDSLETKDIYIAIASMTSPKETYTYYNELIKYISDKLGSPIYIKQKKTYEEVNMLLENSEVDFAFICSGAYVEQNKKVKLLVAPEIEQKTFYNAYMIAQKESGIEKFEDFENRSFAFTDPLSNTGRMFPLKELYRLHKKEQDFFSKTIYTYGHDISIQMVNRGIIDGASVHSIIFDYLSIYHPERVEHIKIIAKSKDFGMPPVVVPLSLDKQRFENYQEIFLSLHEDSVGKEILHKLRIDKFVMVDDTLYNSVQKLKEFIGNENSK